MKYTRPQIMKRAHEIRRNEEAKYGYRAKSWSECLRSAWGQARNGLLTLNGEYVAQVGEEPKPAQPKAVWGYNIPLQWVIEKEVYSYGYKNNAPFFPENEVTKETKKAILIQGSWFPKSVCNFVKA